MFTIPVYFVILFSLCSNGSGESSDLDLWKKNLNDIEAQIRDLKNDIEKLDPEFRAAAISDLELSLSVSIHETWGILRKNGDSSSEIELAEDAFYRFMLFQQNEIIKEIIRGDNASSAIDRLKKLTQDFATAYPVARKLTEKGAISAAIFYSRSTEFIKNEVISICREKVEKDDIEISSVESAVLEIILEEKHSVEIQEDLEPVMEKVRKIIAGHKYLQNPSNPK